MTDQERTTKPAGATGHSAKGAQPTAEMPAPLTPMGPNETEAGAIPPVPPVSPGLDQVGLVGGDDAQGPGNLAEQEAAGIDTSQEATEKADKDMRDADKKRRDENAKEAADREAKRAEAAKHPAAKGR